jgi:transposase-like protein
MTKKSKLTLGLKEDSSNRSNRRYSEQEKHSIIQEMISSGCTKNEIWQNILVIKIMAK